MQVKKLAKKKSIPWHALTSNQAVIVTTVLIFDTKSVESTTCHIASDATQITL